ncbi:hypothetical protein ACFPES_03845 [Paenibacillus sp. GCM10023248]|uniref:hypothetical protein n=1 Tax=unclassified Paenibacillus TaxID=185978 RepID=UPI002378234F|nr:hypothetical protein [Paenibacillus sp. MAHUQ-63]MDD9266160.1 hypothetical protein [Paenibacillus sp. MAHUQ-63]
MIQIKKLGLLFILLYTTIICNGCSEKERLDGMIIKIHDDQLIVSSNIDSNVTAFYFDLSKVNRLTNESNKKVKSTELVVGQTISIYYDGKTEDSFPARIYPTKIVLQGESKDSVEKKKAIEMVLEQTPNDKYFYVKNAIQNNHVWDVYLGDITNKKIEIKYKVDILNESLSEIKQS